jgi:hypothetical protein
MSFFASLFRRGSAPSQSGGKPSAKAGKAAAPVEHKGYVIVAAPFANNGQYQTAGTITREIDGVRKEHRFIRADSYASYDDAVNFTENKARQIVDLQGDRIFNQS